VPEALRQLEAGQVPRRGRHHHLSTPTTPLPVGRQRGHVAGCTLPNPGYAGVVTEIARPGGAVGHATGLAWQRRHVLHTRPRSGDAI
jgi:hypothetical protein